ncbi:peptidyl-prolyl cis-trans isomerase [Paenibacillus allorhizosphaerae]|uniref:peptidylprolyl isomerase n=1 Tax=Paenibacillus allorhizosphaerae TaxID=2849866 RepID=A0ABM8VSH4_9BACL|nr:peptidyl-prolyl cis-trans isomerase [Paenibacillus allorhizosphaerae]CAG7656387.1 Foldase protein PrsA [Paenibacillus allorhizosphaerae]
MRNVKVLWGTIAVLLIAVISLSSVLTANSLKQSNVGMTPDQTKQDDRARPIATVGDKTITVRMLEEQLMSKYGRELLNQIIDHEVIRMEGKAQGISVDDSEVQQEIKRMQQGYDSEEQFFKAMKEQLGFTPEALKKDIYYKLLSEKIAMQGIRITDEQVEAYIKAHADEFKTPAQLKLAQIVTANKDQANRALNDLAKGSDFAQVAKERSLDDATRENGGDLGWLEEDDPFIPAAVMKSAKQLKPGQTSAPIEVDGAFVVLKLKERKEALKTGSDNAIKEQVRKEMALREAPSIKEIIKKLREKWKVTILQSL